MNLVVPSRLSGRILQFCSYREVAAGETVVLRNAHDRDIYIIISGQFRVYDDSGGEDFVLAVLERGAVFGEMSFMDGSPRSASVTAVSDGSLFVMGKKEFSEMSSTEPESAIQFLRFLAGVISGRLRLANDALIQAASETSEQSDTENDVLRKTIRAMNEAVKMELEKDGHTAVDYSSSR